jgi:hypothetical protein
MLQNSKNQTLSLSNVSEDFGRIFKLYGLVVEGMVVEQFEQDQTPSEELNKKFGKRKFTFEQ